MASTKSSCGWQQLDRHALNAAHHYRVEVEARKFALECLQFSIWSALLSMPLRRAPSQ
jgi:hypothetical protein